MANASGVLPVTRSRGRRLFECKCSECGEVRMRAKSSIGRPCHPCAMRMRRVYSYADSSIVSRSSNGTALFECECPDCGEVRTGDRRKIGKPCHPCAQKRRATHAMSGSLLYALWAGVKARCTHPKASNYKYYGGRGVSVCKEWIDSPEAFFEWAKKNGYQDSLELDRIDVDADYSPDNCRFISHQENSQLRRNARCTLDQAREVKELLMQGKGIKEVQDIVGIPYMSVWHISKGNTWRNA